MFINLTNSLKEVVEKLESKISKINIPCKDSRYKTAGVGRSIVFGLTRHRAKSGLHISANTLKYPDIWELLQIIGHNLNFNFSSVMINRDYQCNEHTDNNKKGTLNLIHGFGDYEGGELKYDGHLYDIKNKWLIFDGHLKHSVEPFTGNRNTITFFTK